jgi:hypothetical protein
LLKLREFNPAFTARDVMGENILGVGHRCGDEDVIIRRGDSVKDMKKSGLRVCYIFPIKGKRAADIYDHLVGFDEAIIGVTLRAWKGKESHVLVYDGEKRLKICMKREGWTYEQAIERSGYNDEAWHGPTTPLIMTPINAVMGA